MKVEFYKIEKKVFNRIINLTIFVKKGYVKKIEDPELKELFSQVDERTGLSKNGDTKIWHQRDIDLKRKDQRLGIRDCGELFDEIKEKGYCMLDPLFSPCDSKEELIDLLQQAIHIIEDMGEGELK